MSRVLLTGAGGFVGSSALRALLRDGYEVHAVSSRVRREEPGVVWHLADLHAQDSAEELLGRVRPELLLHLAWYAEHGRFWRSVENVRWVESTLRLMRAFARHEGRRAVLAGTCAEYEWSPEGGVLCEAATPLRPATLYGVSKDATRAVAQALAEETELELAWGRIFFPYGPGEPRARLLPSVACALLAGVPAPVSEGSQVRDFVHVEDVAEAFVALLGSDVRGAVNVGSGEGVTVRAAVELVGAATGRADLVRFGALESRPGEPAALIADVGRLREEVGFESRISLEDGVAATVAWWREALSDPSATGGG
ncbi:MAG TPA: NAD(P)-dependent oxidoreductase [Solirubrobacteraceae bacterium]|nr:NAD(P)-dependent oxidoreductase [Solirubrobacteraceae bacterium]